MSGTNGQSRARGQRPQYRKDCAQQPGDQQNGEWSREQLETMNLRFVQRVEAAFAAGRESPRMVLSLTREVENGLLRFSSSADFSIIR
jgi:hypothetical protein